LKEIALTQGKVAVVSDCDFPFLSQWNWFAVQCRHLWYAARYEKRKRIYMHREILKTKPGQETDHRDGNGLNNWRKNLRNGTHQQNLIARIRTRPFKSSKFRGVTWDSFTGKWYAKTTFNGKTVNLGRFSSEVDAAEAFNNFARKNYGSWANINSL
jgi:hypothetical protein